MKKQFELCCKVIGLLLFCGGLVIVLNILPRFFHAPDWEQLLGGSILPPSALHFIDAGEYAWKYILIDLSLQGIVPILMGLYLMRSNNLVVRLCYPGDENPVNGTERKDLRLPPADDQEGSRSDQECAPPGYE